MGFWDSVTDFVGGIDKDTWGNIASTTGGLLDAYNKNKAQSAMLDAYKQKVQADYDEQKSNHDAYLAYQAQKAAAGSGGGGGGGGGIDVGAYIAMMNSAKKPYKPYMKAGKKLMPEVTKTTKKGLQGLQMLQAYISSPAMMDRMKLPTQFGEQNIGALPDYLLSGDKNATKK